MDNIWCVGLAHLNLVSVLSFSKAWYHKQPRYRFLVSLLSFIEENAQIWATDNIWCVGLAHLNLVFGECVIVFQGLVSQTTTLSFFGEFIIVYRGKCSNMSYGQYLVCGACTFEFGIWWVCYRFPRLGITDHHVIVFWWVYYRFSRKMLKLQNQCRTVDYLVT